MKSSPKLRTSKDYKQFASDIERLLADARRLAARSVNAILTATYWEVGRRIVRFEQHGRDRAEYGEEVIERLSADLMRRFGRGFGVSHVKLMRQFYLAYTQAGNRQSPTGRLGHPQKSQSLIGQSRLPSFPLSWTHYARLLRVENQPARRFYEDEALRGGWSVRQLDRQIESQFYERTALFKEQSRNAPRRPPTQTRRRSDSRRRNQESLFS